MDKTNSTFTGYPIFQPSKKELKNSRFRGGLMLVAVVLLHSVIAFELANAPKDEPKKLPMIMEVSMVTIPKPEPPKPEIKEPPPPPVVKPVAKKEIAKAKPIIKPNAPVKKEIVKKIAAAPLPTHQKLLESQNPQIEEKIQQYEVAPEVTTQPPAPAIAPKVSEGSKEVNQQSKEQKIANNGNSEEVSSGVVCINCKKIESKLKERYGYLHGITIVFLLEIDETGTVKNVSVKDKKIEAEADELDEDTLASIKERFMSMEFEPKTTNGKAVSSTAIQPIKFSK